MQRGTSMDLMRWLHGELPPDEARALELRLQREPELKARYLALRATWEGLDLPPVPALPPGFAGRVMAHVRSEARGEAATVLAWSLAPHWVRASAAAALVVGLGLGAGLGLLPMRPPPAPSMAPQVPGASASSAISAQLPAAVASPASAMPPASPASPGPAEVASATPSPAGSDPLALDDAAWLGIEDEGQS